MNTNRRIRMLIAAAVMLSGWMQASGQATRPVVELGERHVDRLNGFSLRPPTGTVMNRAVTGSRLVSWSRMDGGSGATVWTLSVRKARGTIGQMTLQAYAEALARKLSAEENFDVASTTLAPVAGKPGIHFRGPTRGLLKIWQYQAWVSVRPGRVDGEPGEFLVLSIVGPTELQAELDAVGRAVVETLQLTDPEVAREIMRQNLKHGAELLDGLTAARVAAALAPGERWFLLKRKEQAIGFTKMAESPASEKGAAGVQVVIWSMAAPTKEPARLLKRVLFTTADRRVERWKQQLQIGSGDAARTIAEDGIKQADLIVCTTDAGGHVQGRQKTVPQREQVLEDMRRASGGKLDVKAEDLVVPAYLPRAMGEMLGRLVDLTQASSCAFAVYNSQTHDFDMRTFTVVGPERIELDGRIIQAIRVLDQPAPDQEAEITWLDEKGLLLRTEAPNGLVLELSSRQAVLAKFPAAETVIQGMARWASQK